MEHLRTKDFAVRAVNGASRSARFVASSETVDSYGEIVEQSWVLDRFKTNPVVLYNHMRFGSDLPIGTAEVEMVRGQLECVITFASEKANPMAERCWALVQENVLRAVSVGFRPRTVRTEVRDGEDVIVLAQNELYEISVTPIGANPDALSKAKALDLEAARALAARGAGPLAPAAPSPSSQPAANTKTRDEQLLEGREALWQRHLARRAASVPPTTLDASADAGAIFLRSLDGAPADFAELEELLESDAPDGDAPSLSALIAEADDSAEAGEIFERSFDHGDDGGSLDDDDPLDDAGDIYNEMFGDDTEAAQ